VDPAWGKIPLGRRKSLKMLQGTANQVRPRMKASLQFTQLSEQTLI